MSKMGFKVSSKRERERRGSWPQVVGKFAVSQRVAVYIQANVLLIYDPTKALGGWMDCFSNSLAQWKLQKIHKSLS